MTLQPTKLWTKDDVTRERGPCSHRIVHHSTPIFRASRLWVIQCRLFGCLWTFCNIYSTCYLGSQISWSSNSWPWLQLLLRERIGGILFFLRMCGGQLCRVSVFTEVLPSKMIVKKCAKINCLSVWCGVSVSFRKDISLPSHCGNVRQVEVHRRGNWWPWLTAHACRLTAEWL